MALQVRRGTNAQRLLITPLPGELIYTTDTKNVYVGDGITLGGILVSGSGGGILNEDVQDICGPMFTGGTHTGISFTYDDETGTINAVVTDEIGLTEIVSDTTPELGGNLDLNTFDIFGDGDIGINGSVTVGGAFIGPLEGSVFGEDSTKIVDSSNNSINVSSIQTTGTDKLTITGNNISTSGTLPRLGISSGVEVSSNLGDLFTGVSVFGNTNGALSSSTLTLNASRGTYETPQILQSNDLYAATVFKAHNGSDFVASGIVGIQAVGVPTPGADSIKSQLIIAVGNGSTDIFSSPNRLQFNSDGLLTVDSIITNDVSVSEISIINDEPDSNDSKVTFLTFSDTAGRGSILTLGRARGTNNVQTIVQNGDDLAKIYINAFNGTSFVDVAGIIVTANGTITPGNEIPTTMVLEVSDGTIKEPAITLETGLITLNGVLKLPQKTNAMIAAIPNPEEGMLVYNVDVTSFQWWNGSSWVNL